MHANDARAGVAEVGCGDDVRTLSIQSIATLEEFLALAPQWRALVLASGTTLPFQTWEWSSSWWSYLREDGPGVRDLLRVCVVRNATGKVIGIAPLMLTERPSFGPLRLRILQFIGADPNITELKSLICHPDEARKCYAAIQAYLGNTSAEWDWMDWDGCAASLLRTVGQPLRDVRSDAAYVLTLAPTWHELKQGFKRNIKESLRKCYNSLKRDGLTFRLEVLEEPSDIAQGLHDFFRLHGARAALKGVPVHPDVFVSPQSQAFLTDVCVRLAERGVAKLFQLRIDGRVVATRVAFEMANTLYLYYSGWEPAYGKYSVMTTLHAEIIQHAIARGLTSIHMSTGKDVSKTRWGADEVSYVSGFQLSSRLSSRAMYFAYRAGVRLGLAQTARAFAPARFIRRATPAESAQPVVHNFQVY
jgi:CelD/BcsL family acetyltransferase involved in cellulose biosynthesis